MRVTLEIPSSSAAVPRAVQHVQHRGHRRRAEVHAEVAQHRRVLNLAGLKKQNRLALGSEASGSPHPVHVRGGVRRGIHLDRGADADKVQTPRADVGAQQHPRGGLAEALVDGAAVGLREDAVETKHGISPGVDVAGSLGTLGPLLGFLAARREPRQDPVVELHRLARRQKHHHLRDRALHPPREQPRQRGEPALGGHLDGGVPELLGHAHDHLFGVGEGEFLRGLRAVRRGVGFLRAGCISLSLVTRVLRGLSLFPILGHVLGFLRINLDRHRIHHRQIRQSARPRRQRRGQQRGAPRSPLPRVLRSSVQVGEDGVQVLLEADVEHPIRLVEHEPSK